MPTLLQRAGPSGAGESTPGRPPTCGANRVGVMPSSADPPGLETRQRVPSGPTGALSVLPHFSETDGAYLGAHVAYPSGDAVVVVETHQGEPSTFSRVTFAEASGVSDDLATCTAWAPGDAHDTLLVARGDSIHLCVLADDDDERSPSAAPNASPRDTHGHTHVNSDHNTWEVVTTTRMNDRIVACVWTEDDAGVVASDASGAIVAWRWVNRSEDSDATPSTSTNTSWTPSSSTPLPCAWRCRSDSPQTVLAAGRNVRAPVASAASGSREVHLWKSCSSVSGDDTSRIDDTSRHTLWQTLRHPSTVMAFRWRGSDKSESESKEQERRSMRGDDIQPLVATCSDGAVRVWTLAPTALGGDGLVISIVIQSIPVPGRNIACKLLDASFLSWCPEPESGRGRRNRHEREKKDRTNDDVDSNAKMKIHPPSFHSNPPRDGAEYIAALGSDGAIYVWMLHGFDVAKIKAGAHLKIPKAHLWRRQSFLRNEEEEFQNRNRNLKSFIPAFFSATWASGRNIGNKSVGDDNNEASYVPRSDPPLVRVTLASKEHGARTFCVDLGQQESMSEESKNSSELTDRKSITQLERASFFNGHAFGDVIVSVKVCDATNAVCSVSRSGNLRVWRWRFGEMTPVFMDTSSTEKVTAAAWRSGVLFAATPIGILQFVFCDGDASTMVCLENSSVSTSSLTGQHEVVALDVVCVSSENKFENEFALVGTSRDGRVVGWRLDTRDAFPFVTVTERIGGTRTSDPQPRCHSGTTPCVVTGGHDTQRAFALSCVEENYVSLWWVEKANGVLSWTFCGRLEPSGLSCTAITTIAASPTGAAIVLALHDGWCEVYEAEGSACGAFALAARFQVGNKITNQECYTKAHLTWFNIGGGAEAVVVAVGTCLELRCARRGAWAVLASVDVNDHRVSSTSSNSNTRQLSIGGVQWSAIGDALVVGMGHELVSFSLAGPNESSMLRLVTHATTALPEYHPDVLMDWLVRGETQRARLVARRVVNRLRDDCEDEKNTTASVATLLEDTVGDACKSSAVVSLEPAPQPLPAPSLVPEFDAGGFGAPAPVARFGFCMDQKEKNNDTGVSGKSAHRSVSTTTTDNYSRFTAAEADEAAELVATRGSLLPRLTGSDRVAVLAALDALRDADEPTDAAADDAGRRFKTLRRLRALRSTQKTLSRSDSSMQLDTNDPSGEELIWALQSDKQDALLTEFTASASQGVDSKKIEWQALRVWGVPLWCRDDESLRGLCDKAARQSFASSKDPSGETPCALLFVSLGRQSVLSGLFRATHDARLSDFFARDFSVTSNREAALKNAYALLTKHRYLFAAAFFVLAGQPADAAQLVWKHTRDLSLAVAVVRLAPNTETSTGSHDDRNIESQNENNKGHDTPQKIGGEASDDGMLSMAAFADFGAPVLPKPKPAPAMINTEIDTKNNSTEAPLPFSLPKSAKRFLRADVVPGFESLLDMKDNSKDNGSQEFRDCQDSTSELFWTLASLQWLCGDGAGSIATLRTVASTKSGTRGCESATDLCALISKRKAIVTSAPALAKFAAEASVASTGRLVLLLEQQGMPLAALERRGRTSNSKTSEIFDTDGSTNTRFGDVTPEAASRAQTGVVSRLAAAALAPEMGGDTFPDDSWSALVRLAPGLSSGDAKSATLTKLRETKKIAEEVNGRLLDREAETTETTVPPLRTTTSTQNSSPSRESPPRRESIDLDPESSHESAIHSDPPSAPTTPGLSGLKRLRNKLSIKIGGGGGRGSTGIGSHDQEMSPIVGSPPETPASPSTPQGDRPPPASGFDVLMPGFGVSVLSETPVVANPPAVMEGNTNNTALDINTSTKPHSVPKPIRALRTPVEIARLANDAFYGVCVNVAVPHQLGLGCVKKGLVVADLRRLGAATTHAPDGRAVVGAAAVLQAATSSPGEIALWASRDGGFGAGAVGGVPWPRASWRAPRRIARRAMQGVGSSYAGNSQGSPNDLNQIDWTQNLTAAASAAANAAAQAVGAVDAVDANSSSSTHGVAGDVVARCVESHPHEPVMLAGDAFGQVSIWRFGPGSATDGSLGTVRLPSSRKSDTNNSYASLRSTNERRLEEDIRAGSKAHSKIGNDTSNSCVSPAVSAVAWDSTGARFAAGGSDGTVAVWRSDDENVLDTGRNAAPCSYRSSVHQNSRIEALSFASSTVVALVGSHLTGQSAGGTNNGGDSSLVLWDTLCPVSSMTVAAHEGGATALAWLPGHSNGTSPWPLVATAGRDGDIAAHDLRKLSSNTKDATVLWRTRRVETGVGHAAAVKSLAVLSSSSEYTVNSSTRSLLLSGCKDGDVRVWCTATGQHVQHHPAAHERHTFLAPRGVGRNVLQVGVSKIIPLAGGALTCGGDGTVKLFRLAPNAFETSLE